jgi:hypothetical protein
MHTRLLSALAVAFAWAGLAWAQAASPEPPVAGQPPAGAAPRPAGLSTPPDAPPPAGLRPPVTLPELGYPEPADDECCEPCCPVAFPEGARTDPHFWISGEYLLWWIKNSRVPALTLAGPAPTLPTSAPLTPADAAALVRPGPLVVFDGSDVDNEERSGARFSAGYWFGDERVFGLEASYFFLAARSVGFSAHAADAGDAVMSIRLTFPDPPPPATEGETDCGDGDGHGHKHGDDKGAGDDKHGHDHDRGDPPVPAGGSVTTIVVGGGTATTAYTATVQSVLSSRLQGAEANGVANLCRDCWCSVDLLGGFRFVQLVEGLGISQDSTYTVTATGPGAVAPGVLTTSVGLDLRRQEQFTTENDFYGGQVGARAEFQVKRVFMDLLGKVALGSMHEEVEIGGTTTTATTTTTTFVDGTTSSSTTPRTAAPGLLAQPSNIGSYSRDRFAVVPEATVRLGYQFTDHLRASVGYTFLYASEVVRPGDQIDRVQGDGHPSFSFHGTSFWAQGLDCGLEFRY